MKVPHSLSVVFSTLVFLNACSPAGSTSKPQPEYVLGTICSVNLYEQGRPELYSEIFRRFRELEDILSANRDDTDLAAVNKNAGAVPVKVRPELIEVLEKALEYTEKSGGVFDPSVGPLVKLWGIGNDKARVPDEEKIREALDLIDYREIEIDKNEGTVFLKRAGMSLDLGAIAKGYAADEAVKILAREGVAQAIIDLGGNIFALGEKKAEKSFKDFFRRLFSGGPEEDASADKTFWRVGIQDPGEARGRYIGVLNVKNKSVVTSGIYERFFEEGGKRYHHIFSPKNGFPIENGLLSVTIAADHSIDADAPSTTAFALGWEKGRELITSVPGAEGIFVFDDRTVRLTDGIKKDFTFSAPEYREVDD
jgi:thiamine biosynthesis lipoprotein